MKKEDIFMLQLLDYSSPSFTTISKEYFGTFDDISSFVSSLKNDAEMEDGFDNLIAAFEEYAGGNTSVLYKVAYSMVPFLTPTKQLGSYSHSLKDHHWSHLNTWHCEYLMRFESAEIEHIWLTFNKDYVRAIRGKFKGLQYTSINGAWNNIGHTLWGFPHTIEANKPFLYNRFFVVEKTFATKDEAITDFEQFPKNLDMDFSEICNDIFGDC